MKTIKLFFHSLFLLANVVVVLLFVMAAYSDRVAPEKSLFFAYLGLGFPILCLLNVAFIVYWACLRRWKFLLLGLLSVAVCWGPLTSYFPVHCTQQAVPEGALKVLTYNVMNFAYKNHTTQAPNKIVKYIADSGADLVCLQEYMVGTSDKSLNSNKLFAALHMYPYRAIMHGIAVFSKYPILDSRTIKYKSQGNSSSIHTIDVNGKKLQVINNHLESLKLTSEDRAKYAGLIKNLNTGNLDEFRGTLQQKIGPAFLLRSQQAKKIAEEIRKVKGDYILVCGDFNDTPISYAHRTIQGPLIDSFSESGCGWGISYNQNMFFFRIDHILHSDNMKSIKCTVDKSIRTSDHYPVWTYLVLD